jgi:hypothetical protein
VYEFDRAWLGMPPAFATMMQSTKGVEPQSLQVDVDAVLAQSSRTLFNWIGTAASPLTRDRVTARA